MDSVGHSGLKRWMVTVQPLPSHKYLLRCNENLMGTVHSHLLLSKSYIEYRLLIPKWQQA